MNGAPGSRAAYAATASHEEGSTTAWIILIVFGLFEAVWVTAMSRSEGFTRLPSFVFAVSCLISMGGLAIALKDIPVGTRYAVRTAVGAATTVAWWPPGPSSSCSRGPSCSPNSWPASWDSSSRSPVDVDGQALLVRHACDWQMSVGLISPHDAHA